MAEVCGTCGSDDPTRVYKGPPAGSGLLGLLILPWEPGACDDTFHTRPRRTKMDDLVERFGPAPPGDDTAGMRERLRGSDMAEDPPECAYCPKRRAAGWACSGCPHRDTDPAVAALPEWPDQPLKDPPERPPAGVRQPGVRVDILEAGEEQSLEAELRKWKAEYSLCCDKAGPESPAALYAQGRIDAINGAIRISGTDLIRSLAESLLDALDAVDAAKGAFAAAPAKSLARTARATLRQALA